MTTAATNTIHNFPMGPQIRKWLKISDDAYRGHENTSPGSKEIAAFADAFIQHLEDQCPDNQDHLVDLLEELVGMNMPLLAIKLVDAYPGMFPINDFRAHLHLGNAAMLVSDLARAESAFIQAQKLVPEEPAPYVNLTQIYCHDGLLEQALTWCDAGLETESDNTRLWELMAWIEQQKAGTDPGARSLVINRIIDRAKDKNSWAGFSLACDLTNPEDAPSKVRALEIFWNQGCRDEQFLIEYTAALGMAGQYDKIPAIVWQAEKHEKDKKPAWQLYLHLIQAFMGLGRDDDARDAVATLGQRNDLPDSALEILKSLKAELG